MVRYILAWVPMLLIAVANGALRQLTFANALSETHAHQLSTLIGSVLIGAFIWLVIRRWPPTSARHAIWIGLVWTFLTVVFETFMSLVLQSHSLTQVLHEYNLLAGRVWVLFLAWLTLAPWIFFHLHNVKSRT